MKLRQQPNQIVLAWRFIAKAPGSVGPERFDGLRAIHRRHDRIARRGEPVRLAAHLILEDVPDDAACDVPVNEYMGRKAGSEFGDPIPGRAEKWGLRHDRALKGGISIVSGAAN
jgi:hypothetical protein